jgi:hypothetical protein
VKEKVGFIDPLAIQESVQNINTLGSKHGLLHPSVFLAKLPLIFQELFRRLSGSKLPT